MRAVSRAVGFHIICSFLINELWETHSRTAAARAGPGWPRLTKLDLHHVENINLQAVAALSINCPLLNILRLSGCTFYLVDVPVGLSEDNIDHNYNQSHQTRIINEIRAGMIPFLSLEELSISSPCPEVLIVSLLSLCLNLRTLVIGSMCDITDHCFDQILMNN